jgi:hypothetical protein
LVAVVRLASGVLLDYVQGNQPQHELALRRKLLDHFEPKDLVLGDRGFGGYLLIALLF